MPTPSRYKSPFYPDSYYHIIFKCIDGLLLFQTTENHHYFLQKLSLYLNAVCDCLAYCLLNNHVHCIVHVKRKESLLNSIRTIVEENRTISMNRFLNEPEKEEHIDMLIERQINSFMVGYTNAINKVYNRKGNLFQSPFRRAEIKEESHLQQAIIYTHANAQKHGIIKDFKEYKHSSYWEVIHEVSTIVNVGKVLQFFGGKDKFIEQHRMQVDYFYNKGWPASKLGD
jgi:putative transposase